MTKIRKSRRGFTLLEIVIVVAIIVIVAGAAFLGVTVTLKRATDARNQLKKNNGDNFEVDARNEIEHLKADPNFTPIQEYTPEGETDEDDEDDDDEDDGEDDGEDEEENGGDPVNNQPGNKNSPTPTPTNTPTPTPTNTPTPVPTKVPTSSNGVSATVSGSQTDTPLGKGYQGSTKITGDGRGIRQITITAPEGVQIAKISDGSNSGLYTVEVSPDNTSVTVTFTANWGPSPKSTVDLNYIQWVGAKDLDCTYEITY